NAALTGHLVLSTLHTNSAAGAVPRLLDMQVEPFLLTSTLNIIIAQRLVRRLVGEKESYVLSEAELESLAKHCDLERVSAIFQQEKIIESGEDLKKVEFFKPKPSQEAADGYKGRIGIYEILEVSEQVKDMVQQGTNIDDLQKQAQKEGMRLIIEDGLVKAAKGLTSLEEVMRVITE
ncbi:MAG: Flp pilus assembly complex ATPase component TadA, partial [Patescibacteria group bacterium]|nr:Flp pilus assembly complex ATPase component TadA [Patescibacteria group bacterium]